MSSGRSSQDSACFSVERTKYLMLSKSMPDRSEPQFGMGLRPKYFSPLSRFSSIHSGSFLRAEMSRNNSSEGPGLAEKVLHPVDPVLHHPLRFVLAGGDVAAHLFGEPSLGGRAGHVRVGPAELIRAKPFELVIRGGRHMSEPSGPVGVVARDVQVTWAVQIPSPCAIVARRRTGVSSSRPNASVSASHSWGHSAATCATGQWCWQICAPLSTGSALAAVPLFPAIAVPIFPGPIAGAGPAAAA